MYRPLPAFVALAVLSAFSFAQTPQPAKPEPAKAEAPKAQAPKPEPPPEQKAFSAAMAVKEPDKKAEALEKFIADFPDKPMTQFARQEWVNSLVKAYPKDRTKTIDKILPEIEKQKPVDKPSAYLTLAGALMREDTFLKEADKFAAKAIKLFKMEDLAASMKESAEKAKRPVPTADYIKKVYNSRKAGYQEQHAQIAEKAKDEDKARRLYASALKKDPTRGAAAAALAKYAEKEGKNREAMEYAAIARLSRPSAENNKRFADLYAKVKNGNGGNIEEYLDAKYDKLYPLPIHPVRYERTAKTTDRVVLAQVHTGSGCPPCVAADLAFDAAMERYSRRELAVVMFHQHIPRPDPMTNTDSLDRWKYAQGRGVPTFVIDGKTDGGGGARIDTAATEERIRKLIDAALEVAPKAKLAVETALDGSNVRVNARAEGVDSDSQSLKLNIALAEKMVTYSGENGVRHHPMVVRSFTGYALEGAKSKAVEHTFSLPEVVAKLKKHLDDFEVKDERHNKDGKFRFLAKPYEMNPSNLAVVAWVEDEKTKDILNSIYVEVPSTKLVTSR